MKFKTLVLLACSAIYFGCTQTTDQFGDNPTQNDSKYPYLYSTQNAVFMSWIQSDSSNYANLQYAHYANGQWGNTNTIAGDSTWFVNWADFPSIIVTENGPLAAHWLQKRPGGTYAYDVNISIADSSGEWQMPMTPHHDGTATEHGFVSMIPWNGDTFLAVWLDGRRTANRPDKDYYDLSKAMTLRGALISRSGIIKEKFLIDESVCDCCQTSLTKTENGAIVAYRNRTDEEIRDIYTSRFDGSSWSEPQAVSNDNWKIGACPVNGPKVVASGRTVAVAWHTGASDTASSKVALSHDGGQSFSKAIRLNQQKSVGRVDIALAEENMYVSWMERTEDSTTLRLATISDGQSVADIQTIASLNGSRATGFPQMEILNGKVFFAWTDVDSDKPKIHTKSIALPS